MKFEEGTIVAINKPRGPSSNHAVIRVKKTSRIKRVGHAGTLDPLASGVLVVGIGRAATKLLWGADLQEGIPPLQIDGIVGVDTRQVDDVLEVPADQHVDSRDSRERDVESIGTHASSDCPVGDVCGCEILGLS